MEFIPTQCLQKEGQTAILRVNDTFFSQRKSKEAAADAPTDATVRRPAVDIVAAMLIQ